MNRRELLAAGVAAGAGAGGARGQDPGALPQAPGAALRPHFPGIGDRAFLNAASCTPLGTFAQAGLREYEDAWHAGHDRWGLVRQGVEDARAAFARLVGAQPGEIALVHCTKAGEQIVLDGFPALREGGNVVTNDLHFSGSLHNLEGRRRAGMDVRVVRARDWAVRPEAMEAAMDERTALVSVTLVSNVNGHVEDVAELARLAHARGALVYADVIQAAGAVPLDLRALGVDFAACSTYKWLLGPHGTGFLYVREEHQGSALADALFPGHVEHNYAPWVDAPDPAHGAYAWTAPSDARRYQPGHVSYHGYLAVRRSLALLESIGVETVLRNAVGLNRRLLERVDGERYPCLSPHPDRSPIVTFAVPDPEALGERLRDAGVVVTLAGRRLRVSPSIYNHAEDVDRLAAVLNA